MKYQSPTIPIGTPVLRRAKKHGDLAWFMGRRGLVWQDDSASEFEKMSWDNPWNRASLQEYQIECFGRTWALQ
jgi:hypothetical protein